MATITIELPDDSAVRLGVLAGETQTTPGELVRAPDVARLKKPQFDFTEAADYVLRKDAELYRRLA